MIKIYIQILLHLIFVAPLLLLALFIAGILLIPAIICGCANVKKYNRNVIVAIDQTFNAILGGDEDETISSRAGKRQKTQKWAYYLCKILNKFETGHCDLSIEEDEGDRQILDD